jgi:CBS domain-containing protein
MLLRGEMSLGSIVLAVFPPRSSHEIVNAARLREPYHVRPGGRHRRPEETKVGGNTNCRTGSNRVRSKETTMTVKAILAGKRAGLITIEPTATLTDAVRLLAAKRIGAVVVTGADDRLVGILSERDIVRTLADQGEAALNAPVSESMTRKVVTCAETETISEIMERMTAGKFRHVPVVEQGRLVGIVSIGDVVKSRLEEMERESDALRDYIRTA